jgi:hypothetical protein
MSKPKQPPIAIESEAMRKAAREDSLRLAQLERAHSSLHQSLRDLSVVAKYLVSETDLGALISKIVFVAKDLFAAEGCSVFLVDDATNELYSLAFETEHAVPDEMAGKTRDEVRFPRNKGIIGEVATRGVTEVVADAYADPRFNRAWDDATGFRTRNLLTAPIRNTAQDLVGVLQIVNKNREGGFSEEDVIVVETFAAYCGIAIHNAKMVDALRKEQSRARLALEVMSLHVMPSDESVAAIVDAKLPALGEPPFAALDDIFFATDSLRENDGILAILRMFEELGVTQTLRAPERTLALFVLAVRKSYRAVIYHNWQHAVSVVHAMFCILRMGKWADVFSPIEIAALMLAAIGHDVDHRGENNAFQKRKRSDLDQLYESSSPLERHHLSHLVLVMERTGLLAHLPPADSKVLYATIQTAILATDLARHFPNLATLKSLVDRADAAGASLDYTAPETRNAVIAALIVASDLNTAIKPWELHVAGSRRIYEEFFEQGNREKAFGLEPIEMMDEARCRIPQQQVGFYDSVVKPLYGVLVRFVPEYRRMLESAESNRTRWGELVEREAAIGTLAQPFPPPTHLPTH